LKKDDLLLLPIEGRVFNRRRAFDRFTCVDAHLWFLSFLFLRTHCTSSFIFHNCSFVVLSSFFFLHPFLFSYIVFFYIIFFFSFFSLFFPFNFFSISNHLFQSFFYFNICICLLHQTSPQVNTLSTTELPLAVFCSSVFLCRFSSSSFKF
jgi:hypothetical protein